MRIRDEFKYSNGQIFDFARRIKDVENSCQCKEVTAAIIVLMELLTDLADNKEK